jgi:hypothetical protein
MSPPSAMMAAMNLNDYVWVRLTEYGEGIFAAYYDTLGLEPAEYRRLVDAGSGWCKFQAWALMNMFGPHMGMGHGSPFEGMEMHTSKPEDADR